MKTLKLSNANVNLIGAALVKLPYETVADLLNDLRAQCVQQDAADAAARDAAASLPVVPDAASNTSEHVALLDDAIAERQAAQ